jgi:hypothetical protein
MMMRLEKKRETSFIAWHRKEDLLFCLSEIFKWFHQSLLLFLFISHRLIVSLKCPAINFIFTQSKRKNLDKKYVNISLRKRKNQKKKVNQRFFPSVVLLKRGDRFPCVGLAAHITTSTHIYQPPAGKYKNDSGLF